MSGQQMTLDLVTRGPFGLILYEYWASESREGIWARREINSGYPLKTLMARLLSPRIVGAMFEDLAVRGLRQRLTFQWMPIFETTGTTGLFSPDVPDRAAPWRS